MSFYPYGAVVLIEEYDNYESLSRQCAAMRALHMNTVVCWPPVFFVDGDYDFYRQRALLDAAWDHGLRVVVELTGQVANLEYFPDYLYDDDVAVTHPDGSVAWKQNGLGELNYNHPRVKTAIRRLILAAAAALKDHPALWAWDLWNETHFKSHDPHTLAAFHRWLEKRYGEIGRLNSVWKKSYLAFHEVYLDPVVWASVMPEVDWEEFRTDNLADCLAEWTGWLRGADPDHPVIADNVMANAVWGEFSRGTDDRKVAAAVDLYGISFYPKTGGRLLKDNARHLRTLTFAGAAAAAGPAGFMISEMQSHGYSQLFPAERVSDRELTMWNLEALVRGCRGNVYWKWAPFAHGIQLGGRGLVLADGTPSPRAGAVSAVGKLLADTPDLHALSVPARAALLYDRTSDFLAKAVNGNVRHLVGDGLSAAARAEVFRHADRHNVPVRIEQPDALSLRDILVLFMPYNVTLDADAAVKIRHWVEDGGTLVANYPFVVFSPEGKLHAEAPGGPLHDLVGAGHRDISESSVEELVAAPGTEMETLPGAEPVPLATRRFGRGKVVYAGAPLWNGAFDDACTALFDRLLADLPVLAPVRADLPVSYAVGVASDYLYLSNEENRPEGVVERSGAVAALPGDGWEPIFGTGRIESTGNGWTVSDADNLLLRHTPSPEPLYRIPENRVWRTYLGGRTLDALTGAAAPEDSHFPEDWLLSDVAAVNPGRVPSGWSMLEAGGETLSLDHALKRWPDHFLGAAHVEKHGTRAGLLVKYLDASIRLHLQCHPTVAFARQFLGANAGKTEGYVILGCREGVEPYLYLGFQRPPTPDLLRRWILTQDTRAMLAAMDRIPIKPGDAFLVPGGLPHAIGEGVFMMELMEPTDFAVRLEFTRGGYTLPESARFMGRGIDFALSMLDFSPYSLERLRSTCFVQPTLMDKNADGRRWSLFTPRITPCFLADRLEVDGCFEMEMEGLKVLVITKGLGDVDAGGRRLAVKQGDRLLLPHATSRFVLDGKGLEALLVRPGNGW